MGNLRLGTLLSNCGGFRLIYQRCSSDGCGAVGNGLGEQYRLWGNPT